MSQVQDDIWWNFAFLSIARHHIFGRCSLRCNAAAAGTGSQGHHGPPGNKWRHKQIWTSWKIFLDRLLKFWRKRGNSLSPLGHPRIVGPAPGVKPTNLRPQIWRQYLRSLGLGTDGNRVYRKKIANWLLTFRVQNAYWRHLTSKICSKLGGRERIQRVHAEMMFQNIKNMVVKWQLSLACVCLYIYTYIYVISSEPGRSSCTARVACGMSRLAVEHPTHFWGIKLMAVALPQSRDRDQQATRETPRDMLGSRYTHSPTFERHCNSCPVVINSTRSSKLVQMGWALHHCEMPWVRPSGATPPRERALRQLQAVLRCSDSMNKTVWTSCFGIGMCMPQDLLSITTAAACRCHVLKCSACTWPFQAIAGLITFFWPSQHSSFRPKANEALEGREPACGLHRWLLLATCISQIFNT